MKFQKCKFKLGDKIYPGGAPGYVYLVTNITVNADGLNNVYTLQAPDGASHTRGIDDVDKHYLKSAREYDRQLAEVEKEPEDPNFDSDGYPTFIDERQP